MAALPPAVILDPPKIKSVTVSIAYNDKMFVLFMSLSFDLMNLLVFLFTLLSYVYKRWYLLVFKQYYIRDYRTLSRSNLAFMYFWTQLRPAHLKGNQSLCSCFSAWVIHPASWQSILIANSLFLHHWLQTQIFSGANSHIYSWLEDANWFLQGWGRQRRNKVLFIPCLFKGFGQIALNKHFDTVIKFHPTHILHQSCREIPSLTSIVILKFLNCTWWVIWAENW